MKVGVEHSTKIKEKSIELGMSFAEVAWCYAAEDLLCRIYTSEFKECLWLLGGYKRLGQNLSKRQQRLEFYYIESERQLPINRLIPGQTLSVELQKELFRSLEVLGDPEIRFDFELIQAEEDCYDWQLTALISDMEIPISFRMKKLGAKGLNAYKQTLSPIMNPGKLMDILSYSPENKLSGSLWEIMSKLELISDMEAYAMVNEILKTETINGRHIMEELKAYATREPKVLREKRIDQIKEYASYGYMRKRWQQYQKRSAGKYRGMEEDWETVVSRLTSFMEPVWRALCKEEIFFDDWMPALGRFLG